MPNTLTTTQQDIEDMLERIAAARADGVDVRDLEAQLEFLERSATTAELREEIERDYPENSPDRDRALAQARRARRRRRPPHRAV